VGDGPDLACQYHAIAINGLEKGETMKLESNNVENAQEVVTMCKMHKEQPHSHFLKPKNRWAIGIVRNRSLKKSHGRNWCHKAFNRGDVRRCR
jgi:hypothetical protein